MIKVNKERFIESQKKINYVVFEVTTKQLYVIPKGAHQSIEELKKEWFVEYENRSHAFKDGCLVQFSNNVIEVKEL